MPCPAGYPYAVIASADGPGGGYFIWAYDRPGRTSADRNWCLTKWGSRRWALRTLRRLRGRIERSQYREEVRL